MVSPEPITLITDFRLLLCFAFGLGAEECPHMYIQRLEYFGYVGVATLVRNICDDCIFIVVEGASLVGRQHLFL